MCDCLGLKPITGAEITVADGHHLTLLCENQKGYANLCRLLTHAHLQHERGRPSVELEILRQHTEGLPINRVQAVESR